jgi:F0F1-type ATP synthase epsilon subunit
MAALSEWLQLMLAEIARKRDDLDLARAEEAKRAAETQPSNAPTSPVPAAHEARVARR